MTIREHDEPGGISPPSPSSTTKVETVSFFTDDNNNNGNVPDSESPAVGVGGRSQTGYPNCDKDFSSASVSAANLKLVLYTTTIYTKIQATTFTVVLALLRIYCGKGITRH